jgi:hypothetical protein
MNGKARTMTPDFEWWLSLQPPAHAGSSLADFSTLKMEAIRSSETSVHKRSTRRRIPEDGILEKKPSAGPMSSYPKVFMVILSLLCRTVGVKFLLN